MIYNQPPTFQKNEHSLEDHSFSEMEDQVFQEIGKLIPTDWEDTATKCYQIMLDCDDVTEVLILIPYDETIRSQSEIILQKYCPSWMPQISFVSSSR